ncbi:MAG: hypothetical protein N4A76_16175 [Firmicutes bacterium]|jgi:hypothetical protein|nr:hypothetical protein [Bacillota bacterium]
MSGLGRLLILKKLAKKIKKGKNQERLREHKENSSEKSSISSHNDDKA